MLKTAVEAINVIGSSTCVIVTLNEDEPFAHSCNLGDSSFLHVRDGEALYRAREQTQGFNFPLQVGSHGNDPGLADLRSHPVQAGDLFVLASDGLFDNLYQEDAMEIIKEHMNSSEDKIADALA